MVFTCAVMGFKTRPEESKLATVSTRVKASRTRGRCWRCENVQPCQMETMTSRGFAKDDLVVVFSLGVDHWQRAHC